MKIQSLKGYDDYGCEVVNFSLPTMSEMATHISDFSHALNDFGLDNYEAANAIFKISELLARMQWAESEITALKDAFHDLQYENINQHNAMENRMTLLEIREDNLRSAMDARTENPKQKSDLEIFSSIILDEDFLNFGDSNMFLN